MTRAIVTGAAGFLGGLVADRLRADPRVSSVTGLDRVAGAGGLPAVVADVVRFDTAAPPADIVVHAAAITTQGSESDPDLAYHVNVDGIRAVLRWAVRQPRPPRVVFLSSLAVFGAGDPVVTEATAPDPRTTYGTTKLIAERLLADATRRGGVDGIVLRLPVVIVRNSGRPSQPGAGFVSAVIDNALRGLPSWTPFAPTFRVPVASAAAVSCLAVRAALDHLPSRLIHAPALPISVRDVVDALARCGVPDAPIAHEPNPAMECLVAGWPERMETLFPAFSADTADTMLDPIIRAYRSWLASSEQREQPGAAGSVDTPAGSTEGLALDGPHRGR